MTTTATAPLAAAPTGLAIRCEGLTKCYGAGDQRVVALRGVDLEVPGGELVLLVGPSGCGKTTLISIVAGVLDPDGGRCEVFGTDLRGLDDAARTRWRGAHVGFVFQSYHLVPTLAAVDNVAIPLLLRGAGRRTARERAADLLDRVGLGDRLDARPPGLSGGQQQRVAIARALVHDPDLVVCDEPTAALDQESGRRVMQLLRATAARPGRALLVVTHDHRIFPFADRIARMDDGRVVAVEVPAAGSGGLT